MATVKPLNKKRIARIIDTLEAGGVISRKTATSFGVHHPTRDDFKVSPAEVEHLLEAKLLVCISIGCTGWWWTLKVVGPPVECKALLRQS